MSESEGKEREGEREGEGWAVQDGKRGRKIERERESIDAEAGDEGTDQRKE